MIGKISNARRCVENAFDHIRHDQFNDALSSLTECIDHLLELEKDKARLDWLESQGKTIAIPDALDTEADIGKAWAIASALPTLRDAVDGAILSQAASIPLKPMKLQADEKNGSM